MGRPPARGDRAHQVLLDTDRRLPPVRLCHRDLGQPRRAGRHRGNAADGPGHCRSGGADVGRGLDRPGRRGVPAAGRKGARGGGEALPPAARRREPGHRARGRQGQGAGRPHADEAQGDGRDRGTAASLAHRRRVQRGRHQGRHRGARLLQGGGRPPRRSLRRQPRLREHGRGRLARQGARGAPRRQGHDRLLRGRALQEVHPRDALRERRGLYHRGRHGVAGEREPRPRRRTTRSAPCPTPARSSAQKVYLTRMVHERVEGKRPRRVDGVPQSGPGLAAPLCARPSPTSWPRAGGRASKIPELVNALLASGQRVRVLYTTGNWLDIDSLDDLVLAGRFQ